MKNLLSLSCVCLLAVAGTAQANELANADFETAPANGGAGTWNTFSGGGNGSSAANFSSVMPQSGSSHMELIVDGFEGFAGMYQPLTTTINPGDTVTLTGWQKSLNDPFNGTRELKIEWMGAPLLRVDEFAIGTDYEQFSLQGVAPVGTTGATITYALSTFGAGQTASAVYVDNFDVTIERVPEPASIGLGMLSLVGLLGYRRR